MTVPFIRLDGVRPTSKKRAKEIKARLSSFGIDINLSRSYEILASLSGYRNWATMSASEPEADGSFLLGFQIGGDQFSSDISHWALKRIEIPFSVAKNHIEVIGNGYATTPSLLALAQSAMEKGSPVVLLSANIGVLQTAKISDATGRQDFTARFIGTYEEAPRYEPLNYLSPDEVSGFMNVLSLDCVGSNHEYWTARITWLAKVTAMLVGPSASVEEFTDSMKLENLIRVFQADETADDLRDEVGDYLKSIPRFDPAAKEQNEIARDQHGYVAMRSWALLHPSSKQGVGVKEAQLRKPPFSS